MIYDEEEPEPLPDGLSEHPEPDRIVGRGLPLASRIAIAQSIVARLGDDAPGYIKELALQ